MQMDSGTTIDQAYLHARLLNREDESHKHDYGHLLIVAGCGTMPGAAVLATGAALRSGCGLVTLHSTARALQAVVGRGSGGPFQPSSPAGYRPVRGHRRRSGTRPGKGHGGSPPRPSPGGPGTVRPDGAGCGCPEPALTLPGLAFAPSGRIGPDPSSRGASETVSRCGRT